MSAPDVIAALQKQFPGRVGQGREFRGEWTLDVDREIVREVAAHLKTQHGFNYLVDVSSVDHFGQEPRYEVVYEFCGLGGANNQQQLRVKAKVSEDDATIASLVPVYQGADWHEREVYDMMGITFTGHPDLRRILMWDGYPYYPLRKDFPLEGKATDLPGEAFSSPAPLEGGPFVASPAPPPKEGDAPATLREPRAHPATDIRRD